MLLVMGVNKLWGPQSWTTQRLVADKERLSIPRLKQVAAYMGTNLITNVKNALEGLLVSKTYVRLDSTMALHWISGRGDYKQFIQNSDEDQRA